VVGAAGGGGPPVAGEPDGGRRPGLGRRGVEDGRFLQRVSARAVSEWRAGV